MSYYMEAVRDVDERGDMQCNGLIKGESMSSLSAEPQNMGAMRSRA
jgi:hypothetical protein